MRHPDLAEVDEPMPLDRFLSQRQPERLLVFCDEAAETTVAAAGAAKRGQRRQAASTS